LQIEDKIRFDAIFILYNASFFDVGESKFFEDKFVTDLILEYSAFDVELSLYYFSVFKIVCNGRQFLDLFFIISACIQRNFYIADIIPVLI